MDNVNGCWLRYLRPALPWLLTVGGLVCHLGTTGCLAADSPTTTWAEGHPELLSLFGRPFSAAGMKHRKNRFQPWPSKEISTRLAASQPTLVLGPENQLIAHCWSSIARSTDGGTSWTSLGSPPRGLRTPAGSKVLNNSFDGCGITARGTLLAHLTVQYNDGGPYVGYSDPSYRADLYVTRSTDNGKTWDAPVQLNRGPRENAGGHRCRFAALPDGSVVLAMGAWFQSLSGPLPKSKQFGQAFLWRSTDDGKTWQRDSRSMCRYGAEPDILALPSGRLLATVRYQRHKLPGDPDSLAAPHLLRSDKAPFTKSRQTGKGLVARNTAILHSDDGGKTWSTPRLVTGFDEQTACLVQLPDKTILLVFGHKTDGSGQRFMVSHDEGHSWSRTIFQLGHNCQYASTVLLPGNRLVTVSHRIIKGVGIFHARQWSPPGREAARGSGFWVPRPAEPLGITRSR